MVGAASRSCILRVQMEFLKNHILVMQFKEIEIFLLAIFFLKKKRFYFYRLISKSVFVLLEHGDEQTLA